MLAIFAFDSTHQRNSPMAPVPVLVALDVVSLAEVVVAVVRLPVANDVIAVTPVNRSASPTSVEVVSAMVTFKAGDGSVELVK